MTRSVLRWPIQRLRLIQDLQPTSVDHRSQSPACYPSVSAIKQLDRRIAGRTVRQWKLAPNVPSDSGRRGEASRQLSLSLSTVGRARARLPQLGTGTAIRARRPGRRDAARILNVAVNIRARCIGPQSPTRREWLITHLAVRRIGPCYSLPAACRCQQSVAAL